MKKFNLLCLGLMAGATLAGCSDDTLSLDNAQAEEYVKNFIERFGVPDPNHTFSDARLGVVTVKAANPTDVKVSAVVGRKEYLFAESNGVSGTHQINFDVPQGVKEVKIHANGYIFFANLGDVIDLDKPQESRADSRADQVLNLESKKVNFLKLNNQQKEKVSYTAKEGTAVNDQWYGAISPASDATNPPHYNLPDADNYWRSHDAYMPANLLKQLVGTEKNKENNFYSPENGFVKEQLYRRGWTNPSLYIHYIRKDYEFEMGLMIGSRSTLSSSPIVYCIPMFTTNGLPAKNQMLQRVQTEAEAFEETAEGEKITNIHYRGAEIRFYFENNNPDGTDNNVVMKPSSTQGNGRAHHWDFSEGDGKFYALKKAVEHMAQYYVKPEDGERPLPLPGDMATGLSTFTNGYTGPEIPEYNSENLTMKFVEPFNQYLSYCAHRLEGYDELLGLKEWLSQEHFLFDENDIPEVTPVKDPLDPEKNIPGAYDVTFRMAKKASGYKECDYSSGTRYTTLPAEDKYSLYAGLYGGQSLPENWSGKEFVYYIKDANGLHTTSEKNLFYKKERNVSMSLEGAPIYSPGSQADRVFDVDGDMIPEIIFSENTTGGAPNSIIDPFMWILACEDLGGTDDYDFNDLVVSLKFRATEGNVENEYVDIYPLAAGGTFPAYLMYNEKLVDNEGNKVSEKTYFIGPEIHKWLGGEGTSYTEMLNTGEYDTENTLENGNKVVRYPYPVEMSGKNTFSLVMDAVKNSQTKPDFDASDYAGFWVLVDKNDVIGDLAPTERTIKQVSLDDLSGNGLTMVMHKVGYNSSSVPMMMILNPYWEWPAERKRIEDAYPSWKKWINDQEDSKWYGIENDDDHFPTDINRELVTKRASITQLMKDIENEDLEQSQNQTEE